MAANPDFFFPKPPPGDAELFGELHHLLHLRWEVQEDLLPDLLPVLAEGPAAQRLRPEVPRTRGHGRRPRSRGSQEEEVDLGHGVLGQGPADKRKGKTPKTDVNRKLGG